MGVLEVWCIKIIQSGAAYLYRTGTRVYLFSKNNRCGLLQKSSHSFAGPCGESLSERKLKVWINWCITKVYTWRVMKAKVIMRRVNFTERLTLFVNLRNCMRPEVYLNLNFFFFFIAWKPQDFPETMNIRGEIRNFLFYVREAWTDFLKIRLRPAISCWSSLRTN